MRISERLRDVAAPDPPQRSSAEGARQAAAVPGAVSTVGRARRPPFVEFAKDYYEIEVDRAVVEHVVAHRPLTDALIRALNPRLAVADLRKDIATIGYPITAT